MQHAYKPARTLQIAEHSPLRHLETQLRRIDLAVIQALDDEVEKTFLGHGLARNIDGDTSLIGQPDRTGSDGIAGKAHFSHGPLYYWSKDGVGTANHIMDDGSLAMVQDLIQPILRPRVILGYESKASAPFVLPHELGKRAP